ncbi:MAG: twin-arginine translocase subunit TatC [Bacteroidales bacterium]|nr:twin-arginine translocase subunit TatC [Bacteroidales bacterium]
MEDKQEGEMTFLEHLEELRWHLIRSVLAITAFGILAFVFKRIVFDVILLAPSTPEFWTNRMLCSLGQLVNIQKLCINAEPVDLQNVQVTGQFIAHIKVSIIGGLVAAFPFIAYEFWLFIKPALYAKERQSAKGSVFYIALLFALGVLFGYYLISPLSINFLYNYQVSDAVRNIPTLSSYVGLVAAIVLASGVLFELPVLVYFLSRIGMLTPEFLKTYRRHAIVVILLVSAIITPPDIFSQVMVCIPLLVLYEISIGISRRVNRRREAAMLHSENNGQ